MALARRGVLTDTFYMKNISAGTNFSTLAAALVLLGCAAASAAVFSEQNAASGAVAAPALATGGLTVSPSYTPINISSDFSYSERRRLGEDLAALYRIQGGSGSKLHQQVFGKVSGPDYLAFLTKRVSFIGKAAEEKAYAYSYAGSRGLWLGEGPMKDDTPQVRRLSTLLHEARHAGGENGGWTHAVCPRPARGAKLPAALEGREACDTAAVGAYGIQAVFLNNVAAHCTNCTGKLQMDADMFAQEIPARVIEEAEQDALLQDMGQ